MEVGMDAGESTISTEPGVCLSGLQAIGVDMSSAWIQRAVTWLESIQNHDGGWGESCSILCRFGIWLGKGESTASQTAWALMALMAAGISDSISVVRGSQLSSFGINVTMVCGMKIFTLEPASLACSIFDITATSNIFPCGHWPCIVTLKPMVIPELTNYECGPKRYEGIFGGLNF